MNRIWRSLRHSGRCVSAGIHSAEEMSVILKRERTRADRTGDEFTLLAFSTDNVPDRNAALIRLIEFLKNRLRLIDDVGCLDNERVGVLLPSTPAESANTVIDDACSTLADEGLEIVCEVYRYPSSPGDHSPKSNREQQVLKDLEEIERNVSQLQSEEGVRVPETESSRSDNSHGSDDRENEDQSQTMEPLFIQPMPMWKRCLDIIGASVGLVMLSPLFVIVAAAIRIFSPGPAVFKQLRSGQGGKPFWMYKFRSMVIDAEAQQQKLLDRNEQDGPAFKIKDDPRVTPLGRFLRKTSIDELPQLWNVLKGDMSLVGPRPLPCHETDACAPWQRKRMDVKPGLTCVWQVKQRSRASFEDWMRMDMQYVHAVTPAKDVKLILQTLPAVIRGKGAH